MTRNIPYLVQSFDKLKHMKDYLEIVVSAPSLQHARQLSNSSNMTSRERTVYGNI